jgi:hypothetical protein
VPEIRVKGGDFAFLPFLNALNQLRVSFLFLVYLKRVGRSDFIAMISCNYLKFFCRIFKVVKIGETLAHKAKVFYSRSL